MIGLVFWASVAVAIYAYFGYPLLLTALSGWRRDPQYPDGPLPPITLVVAAYNEESVIAAKLESVLRLEYPRDLIRIVVAADGSDDSTADVVRSFADRGVELLHHPERKGKMAALERAVDSADGDIVVFSDANNRFRRNALIELVRPFVDPGIGAVTGRKVVAGSDGLGHAEGAYWRYESHLRRMENRLGCTVAANGEIFAMRRVLFRPAPPGTINDDQWLAHNVIADGHNVAFAPRAVSEETVSATVTEEAERRSRIVAGQLQVLRRARFPWRRPLVSWMLVSHKVMRLLVGPALILALLSAAVAVVAGPDGAIWALGAPWGALALGGQLLFYGAAAVGDRLPGTLAFVPRFVVAQNLATLRGWRRHLRRGQAAAWVKATREPVG